MCKTDGAIYEMEFEPAGILTPATIYCRVFLPEGMDIAVEPGEELKKRIHDAMETALAPLWEANHGELIPHVQDIEEDRFARAFEWEDQRRSGL